MPPPPHPPPQLTFACHFQEEEAERYRENIKEQEAVRETAVESHKNASGEFVEAEKGFSAVEKKIKSMMERLDPIKVIFQGYKFIFELYCMCINDSW